MQLPVKNHFHKLTKLKFPGWKRWREILPGQAIMPKGSNSYKIYDLTWPAIIPIRSKLNIDLLSEENGKEICHYLTLTI